MLDKEKAGRITKIIALIVALSFAASLLPLLSSTVTGPSTRVPGKTTPASPEQKAADLVGQASFQFQNKNFPGAAEDYQKALSLDPKNAAARAGLGASQLQTGQIEPGYNLLKEAVSQDPDLIEGQFYLGEAAAKLGKNDDALAAYKAYLKAAPAGSHATDAKNALENLKK